MDIEYTFEDDKLNRKSVSEDIEKNLELMQEKNHGHAVSFAINAKWGEGKTFFIKMWGHKIEEKNTDVVVYYNAWENDDCDSAILPLLYNIISIKENEDSDSFIEHAKFFMKALGMNTLKFSANKLLGNYSDVADIVSASLEETRDTKIKTLFMEYDEYYGKRRKLQENLKELVPNNGNLWVFIDDLDRCNPTFAINTLECIKHFFNIDHIIFIFAIDYDQLTIAAERFYGSNGIDSASYMKKFFDIIYLLPSPDRSTYIEYKIQDIQNAEVHSIIKRKKLEFYFKKFEFSLRDIDLTMRHIELFFLKYLEKLRNCKKLDCALNIYFYFICLKDKFNREYRDIIQGHFLMEGAHVDTWPVINKKFLVNNEIDELLATISNGQAEKHTVDIMNKYSMIQISSLNSFADHMEYVLR